MASEKIDLIFDLLTGKDNVKASLKGAQKEASVLQKGVSSIGSTFKSLGGAIFSIQGAIAGLAGAFAFSKTIAAANKQEDAINRLNVALKTSGEFSQAISKDFQNFASSIQAVTTVGDETILNQIALAKSFGATNDQAKQITSAAVDLSAAMGISLESATRNVAKTLGGLTGELGESIPELKNFSKEQLQAGAALDVIAAKFKGSGTGAIRTFSGATTQLSNTFGDLLEEIGFLITKNPALIKAISEISKMFAKAGQSIRTSRLEIIEFINNGLAKVVGFFPALLRGLDNSIRGFKLLGLAVEIIGRGITSTLLAPLALLEDQINSLIKRIPFLKDKLGEIQFAGAFKENAEELRKLTTTEFDKILNGDTILSNFAKSAEENIPRLVAALSEAVKESIEEGVEKAKPKPSSFTEFSKNFMTALEKEFPKLLGTISQGAAGARSAFSSVAGMAGDIIAPGFGPAIGQITDLLSQGPEAVRNAIGEFTGAIPMLIENIIISLPVLIDALVVGLVDALFVLIDRMDEIVTQFIQNLIRAIPRLIDALIRLLGPKLVFAIIESFVEAVPFIAKSFVGSLVKEIPNMVGSFISELVKGAGDFIKALIGKLTGGLAGGGGGGPIGFVAGAVESVFEAITSPFKLAKGGVIPQGFPNDTFPARLTSGERVLNAEDNKALTKGISENNAILGRILMAISEGAVGGGNISIKIGERELANVLLDMNRNNLRTA